VVTRSPSQVRVAGPLAPHADGFRAELSAQGFSPWSQMFYLHLLADVSRRLDKRGLDASGLTDANASAFRQDRRSRGRARFRGTRGLALLVSFLRDAGAAPPPTAPEPGDETAALVAEFAGYLAGERGLRPQTVALYSAAARRFLDSLPGGVPAGLTAGAVRSFVIAESGRRGTGSLKNQVTAVRSLLRFLHLRGRIPGAMDGAALRRRAGTGRR
jgi:integrase/recombinase XerD